MNNKIGRIVFADSEAVKHLVDWANVNNDPEGKVFTVRKGVLEHWWEKSLETTGFNRKVAKDEATGRPLARARYVYRAYNLRYFFRQNLRSADGSGLPWETVQRLMGHHGRGLDDVYAKYPLAELKAAYEKHMGRLTIENAVKPIEPEAAKLEVLPESQLQTLEPLSPEAVRSELRYRQAIS